MSTNTGCRVVFQAQGKGGVGKTEFAKNLAIACEVLGVEYRLVDCDDETSTLSRFFPQARFLPIRTPMELDGLVQIAVEERPQVLAVDLPARAGEELTTWFSLVPFDDLRAVGVTFVAVGVVAASKDSVESVLRWRDVLGDNVDWLLALNRRDDLSQYLQSNARQRWLSEGIAETEIPRMEERLAVELDRANWTVLRALAAKEPCYLTQIMVKARLRRHRDLIVQEFSRQKSIFLK